MSRRINVMLDDTALAALERVAPKGQRSRFISRAVVHFVRHGGKQSLRERLKAEALANADRDLEIAREWFPLEEEAWRRTAPKPRSDKRK